MKRLLIFDMDGVLSDSSEGILYCYRKTGEEFGRADIPEGLLRSGLGGPFAENIMRILDIPPERTMDAVKVYVSHYIEKGFDMCSGFPGTREALEALRAKGYVMCVATMMAEEFALRTMERLGLRDLFLSIRGASLKEPVQKRELVGRCLSDAGATADEAVMIGDTEDDLEAAKAVGMDFVAVTYGYGFTDESCERRGLRHARDPKGLSEIL